MTTRPLPHWHTPIQLDPTDAAKYPSEDHGAIATMWAIEIDLQVARCRECGLPLEHDSSGLFCHNPKCPYFGFCPPNVCVTGPDGQPTAHATPSN